MSATASRLPAVDGHLIDEYLAGLSRRLTGPRRVKADLLAEARDGLVDAAEAYADAGLPAPEATARALSDFGGYRQVVADYQAELAAAQGRRTALLVAVVMPAMLLMSRLMWTGSPWTESGPRPVSGYLLVASTLDILQLTAAIMALLTLLGYGWGSRFLPAERVPAPVLLTRLMGVGVLVFVAVEAVTGFVIYAWSVRMWPVAADWPPMMAGAVLVPLVFIGVARSGLRCLRTSAPGSLPRLG
ncbi:permease prefix domain 1-containing protein [Planosporangium sp. 12N6]|uniref:permease prefix domain 1-containing protein n=1 Tax=Planosporangium spinosum TaxID=3402278 RepID=UPI003CF5E3C0